MSSKCSFRAAQIQGAQRLLSQLQERISGEEASSALNWFRVDVILESTALSPNTKFYALQVLARHRLSPLVP